MTYESDESDESDDDAHDIRTVFRDIPSTVAALGAIVDGTPVTMVVHQNENGAIFLEGSPIWLECLAQHEYPAGDHAIIVLRVERVHREARNRALVWTRDRAAC